MKIRLQRLIPVLVLGIMGIIEVPAQTTFNVVIKDTIYDHQIMDAVELPSGNFIIVDVTNLNSTTTCARILKIDTKGEVRQQKNLTYEGLNSTLFSVCRISDNEFLCSGMVHYSGIDRLWICSVDTSLNVLKEQILSLAGNYLVRSKVKTDSNNDLICFGTVEDNANIGTLHFFIYKLSVNLDSLYMKIFFDNWGVGLDLIERNDHRGYYSAVLGVNPSGAAGNILSLDTSLNIRKIVHIAHDLNNFSSIAYTDQTHLIVTGEYSDNGIERDIGAVIYDTSFIENHFSYFGKTDTVDCPGLLQNIDLPDVNAINIAGTANFDFSGIFVSQDSWYFLNNFDTTLGLNWQKYYGGNGFYTLFGILKTKDNGSLMYGTFWDFHNSQNFIRYLSLIKVDKDGLLLSINNDLTLMAHEAIIYPNPGSETLNVKTQLKNSIFILYDLTGKEVTHQNLAPGPNTVIVQKLQPGFYNYKIIQSSQVKECGKWIKY